MTNFSEPGSSSSNSGLNFTSKVPVKKNGSKKLTIKPFKAAPKLPPTFEEDTWAKLHAAVVAVQHRQAVGFSEEELYMAVKDLCIHKLAANLYDKLKQACSDHIQTTIGNLVGKQPDPLMFLHLMAEVWDFHCEQLLTIKLIFGHLDRTYVINNTHLRSIWDMGLDLFGKYMPYHAEVQQKTVEGLLMLICRERDGDTVDRLLIQKLVRMFMALGTYKDTFESLFMERTRDYYAKEGQELLHKLQVGWYLAHVEKRLSEENDRVLHYLDAGTRRPLIAVLEELLLQAHVSTILGTGFDFLMSQNMIDDLARIYRLFGLVNAHDSLRANFQTFIKKTGLALVMDEEKDATMVTELLSFKAKLDLIWEKAFAKNESFGYALRDSFESFINQRQNKPAELIAKFLDGKLRSGNKGETEEEIEDMMDRVMVIFRFVSSKDVFEAFYKKDLAKRLLLGKSASSDAEKSVISKLKAECGTQLSGKLEGMFKDIDLSRDIMSSFRQSKESRDPRMGDVDLNVFVLTTGYWPTYQASSAQLPIELSQHQEVFKSFYLSKHQGRRLTWQSSLAHCVVKARFPLGKRELSVSLFQTLVLMLFNDADELNYKFIKENTGIEEVELKRILQSLALGKVRPLKKRPAGQEINDDDRFAFAADFTHKLLRIKINQIQMKETAEENKHCTEKIFEDRQHQIDAAIVRIMKARKSLTHSQLLQELFAVLKFPVQAVDLKKRMESLIEREYMARDEETTTLYHYVA